MKYEPSDSDARAPKTSGPEQGGTKPVSRRLWKVIVLLIALPLLLSACPSWYSWNQKLSLTLDTPNGPLVASTVQQVKVTYMPQWMGLGWSTGPIVKTKLTGEGLALDLGDGRIMLSLLHEGALPHWQFRDLGKGRRLYAAIENQIGQPPRQLEQNLWPEFVSFLDRNDPLTAFWFFGKQPKGSGTNVKDIADVFGPGYKLREMTVEITDEPVSIGNVKRVLGPEFMAALEQLPNLDKAERLKRQQPVVEQFGIDSRKYFYIWDFIRDIK